MMKSFVFLVSFLAVSNAMVCFKGICDHLKKPELHCKGDIIKNGGICGCYDVCAKIEGEVCQTEPIRGRLPLGTCEKGLTCVDAGSKMMIGTGICKKSKDSNKSVRDTRTLCEQRRTQSMISMVVYRGQWFPKCDAQSNFMPQQCDNTGMCFCVDESTGIVDESSKVLGAADC